MAGTSQGIQAKLPLSLGDFWTLTSDYQAFACAPFVKGSSSSMKAGFLRWLAQTVWKSFPYTEICLPVTRGSLITTMNEKNQATVSATLV